MKRKVSKHKILKIASKYLNELHNIITEKEKKRGRPKKYDDKIIIFALILKVLKDLSFRELEEELRELKYFNEIPDFSTMHYRINKLQIENLNELVERIAKDIMKEMKNKEFYCVIADGTGFGYADTYKLSWKRGKELRKVKSHVKTEILIGIVKGIKVVIGVNTGKAYSDECKLLTPMLDNIVFGARYFLGDAYYGKEKVIKKVEEELKMKAIIPVKDTTHKRVRNEYRKKAKENYEKNKDIYKKERYKIEQLIGNIKNEFKDRDNLKDLDMARLHVIARFIIYNIIVLAKIIFFLIFWLFLKSVLETRKINYLGFFKQPQIKSEIL
ncbi:IS5-like element ISAae1 family transposase [Venenivibrio stagnispumantis]